MDDQDYWAKQMDPVQVRVVNWSRRRKRNKKLWSPFPNRRYGAGPGKKAMVNRANELRARALG
jgi:hypothetical protein